MSDLASKPTDVARLMTRIGVGRATYPQMIVCVEVTRAAIEGVPLRPWKSIAADWHIDPAILSRAKALLGVRYVETPDGPRINLDPELWFPADESFGQAKKAAQWLAEQCNGRLIKSQGSNGSTSQLDHSVKSNCGIDQFANSQCDQSVNSPRTPVEETHAGAVCLPVLGDTEEQADRVGAGGEPVWTDAERDRIAPTVRAWLGGFYRGETLEAYVRDIEKLSEVSDWPSLEAGIACAAKGKREGWLKKSPVVLIRKRAGNYYAAGEIEGEAVEAVRHWRLERPPFPKPAPGPEPAPESAGGLPEHWAAKYGPRFAILDAQKRAGSTGPYGAPRPVTHPGLEEARRSIGPRPAAS